VTSAAELDRLERDSFLSWRRELAELEEVAGDKYRLTPFEKNLEVSKGISTACCCMMGKGQ